MTTEGSKTVNLSTALWRLLLFVVSYLLGSALGIWGSVVGADTLGILDQDIQQFWGLWYLTPEKFLIGGITFSVAILLLAALTMPVAPKWQLSLSVVSMVSGAALLILWARTNLAETTNPLFPGIWLLSFGLAVGLMALLNHFLDPFGFRKM